MNDKPSILYVLQSRKWWSAVIGLILILVTAWNQHPFPTDAVVTAVMGVVAAYMASVALEDGLTKHNAGQTTVSTPSSNVDISTSDTPAKPTVTNQGLL